MGYLSQHNGNAINYSPTTKDCNIKTCKDESDAMSSLEAYHSPYDVYYCDRELILQSTVHQKIKFANNFSPI